MYKLTGKIQHYGWGGYDFIPRLLGIENKDHRPFAEYWLGTHLNGPARVHHQERTSLLLPELIQQNPGDILGSAVNDTFGDLPYLLKVLDVRDMLSIQVHPSKAEAEKGFARENELGIPLQSAHRNYKDDNHKPEVMVALSEFWLLHGFKEKDALIKTLSEEKPLNALLPVFEKESYYGLYRKVMQMQADEVDTTWRSFLIKARLRYQQNQLQKDDPTYWACKATEHPENKQHPIDRGIFSIYFFNIVHLHPGQAIFQAAGIPHAYLEGQNIELMSNSDNVLRGGLTPKHIDVPELLKHTLFEGITPLIMNGETCGNETIYPCPVPDFELSKIDVINGSIYEHRAYSVEILLVTEGASTISSDSITLSLTKGESVLVPADERYRIIPHSKVVIYKAGVPPNH